MFKYLLGLIQNLFNPAISFFTLIDNHSNVNRNAKVYRFAKVYNSNIDSYSYVCSGTSIVFANVGKFCSIAGNCHIGLGTHTLDKLSTSPIFTEKNNATSHSWTNKSSDYPYLNINIGNDVWIGENVIIMGGVNIGDGAVIGAGAIVTKDIPAYAIAVGVPAKVIKYRFDQHIISKLLEIKWWSKSENFLKKNIFYFQRNEIDADLFDKLENDCKNDR